MPVFLRVAAVEGRLVSHPAAMGSGVARMIGHVKYQDGVTFPYGINPNAPDQGGVPWMKYKLTDEDELVQDTSDCFIRYEIQHGGLVYIESVEARTFADAITGKGRTYVDPELAAFQRKAS